MGVLVTDYYMPVMNGIDATIELRKRHAPEHLPIIALTASAMSGDRERFLQQGFTAYLSKPIEMERLRVHGHDGEQDVVRLRHRARHG